MLLQDTREYLCCSLLQVTCSCRLSKAKPLKDCFGVCAEEWGGIIIHLVALQKGQGSSQSLLCADTTNSSINLGCQTATWNAMLFKGTLHINYASKYVGREYKGRAWLNLSNEKKTNNSLLAYASSAKIGFVKRAKPLELISIIPLCAPQESRVQFPFISMCHETAYHFFFPFFLQLEYIEKLSLSTGVWDCWMWNLPTGRGSHTLFWGILGGARLFIRFTAGSKLDES